MIIVNKKTLKHTKLHIKNCVICNVKFGTYNIYVKLCSKICKSKLNGLQKRNGYFRICKICKISFYCKPSEDRRGCIRSYCSKECQFSNKKLGLPNNQYLAHDGYIVCGKTKDNRKQIKLHRVIMEEHIGRILLPTEIVHHINEDKLDNRLENLQIVTRSEHNKIHKFLCK